MLGLFTENSGGERNLPAMRFGNLSQVARMPVPHGNGAIHPAHVFDMHSRPGFSGSPVFVYRTPESDLFFDYFEASVHGIPGVLSRSVKAPKPSRHNRFVRLLGIHSGQFYEHMEATVVGEAYGKAPICDGDKIQLPSSMTVVVPAWDITELLDLPFFQEQREMRDKRRAKEKPTVKGENAETAKRVEREDANPRHKEDFTRLLNAAVKGSPSKNRT